MSAFRKMPVSMQDWLVIPVRCFTDEHFAGEETEAHKD